MRRQYVNYFRNRGLNLIQEMFPNKEFSFQDFYDFFDISDSPEVKKANVEQMIQRLVQQKIIVQESKENSYSLAENSVQIIVELANLRKVVKAGYYNEPSFLKPPNGFLFVLEKKSYANKVGLGYYIVSILEEIDLWNNLGSNYGQILNFVRSEFYNQFYIQWDTQKLYEREITDYLERYKDLKSQKDYPRLKAHFQKCYKRKCSACGGNYINRINRRINIFLTELKKNPNIETFFKNLEDWSISDKDNFHNLYHEVLEITRRIFTFQDPHTLHEWVLKGLGHPIRELVLTIYNQRALEIMNDKKLHYEEINTLVSDIHDLLEPRSILNGIDSRLMELSVIGRKVYSRYNKAVKESGRLGEKCIYDGLRQDHPEKKYRWNNEDSESRMHYDILEVHPNGEKHYIEVKTTKTDQFIFEMSKEEIKFAEEKGDAYKIYLIVNAGSGVDSFVHIVRNFKELRNRTQIDAIAIRFKCL